MELRIDRRCVERCRKLAAAIADPVETFIAAHSTVSVERAVLRLLGVDGITADEVPVPNAVVDSIPPDERGRGVALPFGKALAETGLEPLAAATALARRRDRAGAVRVDAGERCAGRATPVRRGGPRSHRSAGEKSGRNAWLVFRNFRRRCCT